MIRRFLVIATLLTSAGLFAAGDRIEVGNFSAGDLAGWEGKSFVGETSYTLTDQDGRKVLLAKSFGTASGMGRKLKIDLTKTPYVNWSWKIERGLPELNEKTKNGDDYAARLYVVKSGGALIWNTRALNYVWSGSQARDSSWPNAFKPKNAIMLAARGDDDTTGVWVDEKRNVREDFKKMFGKDIKSIDAIAIMTDTDNSGLIARAAYGDIFFTAN